MVTNTNITKVIGLLVQIILLLLYCSACWTWEESLLTGRSLVVTMLWKEIQTLVEKPIPMGCVGMPSVIGWWPTSSSYWEKFLTLMQASTHGSRLVRLPRQTHLAKWSTNRCFGGNGSVTLPRWPKFRPLSSKEWCSFKKKTFKGDELWRRFCPRNLKQASEFLSKIKKDKLNNEETSMKKVVLSWTLQNPTYESRELRDLQF